MMQIDLFNKLMKLILYGCEIWGMGNIDVLVLERVQLNYFK